MADELARIAKSVERAADTAAEAARVASENRGLLSIIRDQTNAQWKKIQEVQQNSIRQTTILERVVEDQKSLAKAIKSTESGVNEYKADRRVLLAVKWFASVGGLAGLAAIAKDLLSK